MPSGKKSARSYAIVAPSLSRHLIMPCHLRSDRSNLFVLRRSFHETCILVRILRFSFLSSSARLCHRSLHAHFNDHCCMAIRNLITRFVHRRYVLAVIAASRRSPTLTKNLTDWPQLKLIRFYLLDASLVTRFPLRFRLFRPLCSKSTDIRDHDPRRPFLIRR